MTSIDDDRIEYLLAAAVAGELTAEEGAELAGVLRERPELALEIAELRTIVGQLEGSGIDWAAPQQPPPALRERIAAIPVDDADELSSRRSRRRSEAGVGRSDAGVGSSTDAPRRRRPPRWLLLVAVAASLGAGLVVGVAASPLFSLPPSGPPGTLGAIERLDVQDEWAGTDIEAEVVAHTWGTETVLDATGLDAGATYAVVLISVDGTEFAAGEMLGSEVPIHCRLNAAVLREDATRLEIRGADGVVAAADLPEV